MADKKKKTGAPPVRKTTPRNKPALEKKPPARPAPAKKPVRPGAEVKPDAIGSFKDIWQAIWPRLPIKFQASARRPDDLLVFDLTFYGFGLAAGPPPKLVRKTGDAYIVAELPPQSFGEQAFLEVAPEINQNDTYPEKTRDLNLSPQQADKVAKNKPDQGEPVPPLPSSKVRMARPSRIAFTMPAGINEIPYTLAAVLEAFRTWEMRLDYSAAPEPSYEVFAPGEALHIDRDWLKAVVQGPAWSAAAGTLTEALDSSGATRARELLEKSAQKLADKTAQALSSRRATAVDESLQKDMLAELDAISAPAEALSEPVMRDAAAGLLALETVRRLVQSRLEFVIDHSILARFLVPHEPSPGVTALELPYRLILSPLPSSRWLHRDDAFTANGRTELWHTHLTTSQEDFGPDKQSKVRAIWSPDYPIEDILPLLEDPVKPFRMSLDPLDRKMLVQLMAGYNEENPYNKTYIPRASVARRLMLSALGGLLDSEGNWRTRPKGVGLEQWRHLATLGRDQYVRVVYAGYLFPFGHAASLIKVTERKFESIDGTNLKKRVAVLRQRFFIVVRERTKAYDGSVHKFYGGRNFPFQSVEILTRVTPNLLPPETCPIAADPLQPIYNNAVPPRAAFWPKVGGGMEFPFKAVATDVGGNRTTFAMPLLFVGDEANQAKANAVIAAYNLEGAAENRKTALGNATVCYAPIKEDAEGDPRLPTSDLTFKAGYVTYTDPLKPLFYPEIENARVGIRSVQKLLGQANATIVVEYPDVYKQHGFTGPNPGEVFLKAKQDYPLQFGEGAGQPKSDALGALATPSMAIQGLSRVMGPAADLDNVTTNKFNPADFFKDARILGGISLADILEIAATLVGADVPKLLSKELPDRIEASFNWKTEIKQSDPLNLFVPNADGSNPTPFEIKSVITTPLGDPTKVSSEAIATLKNFKVNLFGFIILWFDDLKFSAKSGSKPDVSVDMHPKDALMFGGPLEFVNDLRQYIPIKGFSDPPSLAVTPSGITASYSLDLPSIQVGIFALSNLSLGAGFLLPFDSNPAQVKFNFCERQSPFNLTVSFLGGGGFFAIGIGTEGVREIEAALEFGAGVSIDLGVASGGVEIKAGVYFHWLEVSGSKTVELTGYVRLHGELSILGLISASLTFNLSLSYLKENGASTVWGEAELTIEIEILFFNMSVSVSCRREFGGGESDPKVIDLISDETAWLDYCAAYAEEAA